ncbi:hypothetical protein [uncultured Bartonella sp.]|uniref:hypothetical protein n=1 Tax=uncultured Bartonella sp. TaxID=104108 RepID=UPI00261B9A04|nr:hypothetical protein [uncultured Bartonella sp.]
MRSTRSVLYFSLVLTLLSVVVLAYTLLFHGDFISHNIIFNSIIATFDAIVLLYTLFNVFYIKVGMKQWEIIKRHFPRGEEEPPLRGGMRLLRGRLHDLISFNEDERNSAIALVSRALDWRVDFLFYAAGAVISMGLLGTFFGLTFTMEGIRNSIELLSTQDEVQAKLLVTSLAAPLGGMATAFSSSMFGLGSSICTGLVAHFIGRATDGWVYDIEKWSFVASGEEASRMVGENNTVDATTRAINRLAAVLSRHVELARLDTEKFIEVSGNFVQGQADQQDTMEKMLDAIALQSENNKQSINTILATVANSEVTMKQLLGMTQNNNQVLSDLNDTVKTNTAYIARGTEAQDRNSETLGQAIASVNQIRVQFVTGLEAIVERLKELENSNRSIAQYASQLAEQTDRNSGAIVNQLKGIENNSQSIAQYASEFATHSDKSAEVIETAVQVMRGQQNAIMEGMRELTEARVSIVSAIRVAQTMSDDSRTKG